MNHSPDGEERSRPRDEFSRALSHLGIDARELTRLEEVAQAFERMEWKLLRDSAPALPDCAD